MILIHKKNIMDKIKVCILGVGGIGRHHLRSSIEKGFDCIGVDPFSNIEPNCIWLKSIEGVLDHKVDLFVISTSASLHFEYIKFIEENFFGVKIIVEKPLFTSRQQYCDFEEILKTSSNDYFINLPFSHNEILSQTKFKLGRVLTYSSKGTNWGLTCNLLHDISILSHFTEIKNIKITNIKTLVKAEFESKRKNYFEIYGQLSFRAKNIDISLESYEAKETLKTTKIIFDNGEILIDHDNNIVIKSGGEKIIDTEFSTPRASDTTGNVIESIMKNKVTLPYASDYIDISLKIYENLSSSISKKQIEFPFS